MHNFLIQTERKLRALIGYIILPCFLLTILLKAGIRKYNFSGILDMKSYRIPVLICLSLVVIFLIRCFAICIHNIYPSSARIFVWIFACCAFCAVMIPYEQGHPVSSTIHLISAYWAFGMFTFLLFLMSNTLNERLFYAGLLILFFLLCIDAGEISGTAEVIYATGSSWLLTYISLK